MELERPFLSSYTDSRGKLRWRFRREGKTISLRGKPGEPEFEARYRAALHGNDPKLAVITPLPGAARPKSFGAAWRLVKTSPEWKAFSAATHSKNTHLTEMFLISRVAPDAEVLWRDVLVSDFKRRHAKIILSEHAATPHKAKHMLTAIRRLIVAAMDEEWIESDPTFKLKWVPSYKGWRLDRRRTEEVRDTLADRLDAAPRLRARPVAGPSPL